MPHVFAELAREAVEKYIKNGEIISVFNSLPQDALNKKAGVFVSIFQSTPQTDGEKLRGCIGTYLPTKKNIAEEIIHNAIAAATGDNRFKPIQESHLPLLSFSVYILDEPEPVRDVKELDPKKYGVIVINEHKSGLLLPDLSGIDTVEKQLNLACQKGGIDPAREQVSIYKFTAEKYQ